MAKQVKTQRVKTFGMRGRLVRVKIEKRDGKKKYVVQWGPKRKRGQRSFEFTDAGKVRAIGFAETLYAESLNLLPNTAIAALPAKRWRARETFKAYMLTRVKHLRGRSVELYSEQWTHFESWFGADRALDELDADAPYTFRAQLDDVGYATKTQHSIVSFVRSVFAYAARTEKIKRNPWVGYRFEVAKEKRTEQRAEYRRHEFLAIWKQFDPTRGDQWRGFVVLGLLGIYGMRQSATLQLRESDVDEAAGTLTFRSETDKQGETHVVALTPLALAVLEVSRRWRARMGYWGPYLLPPGSSLSKTPHYTLGAFWTVLQRAEQQAGIEHIDWRAGHGFRRGLVGDLVEDGFDIEMALQAIGDKDTRMARHYLIRRNDRIDQAIAQRAEILSLGATKVQHLLPKSTKPATANGDGPVVTVETPTT